MLYCKRLSMISVFALSLYQPLFCAETIATKEPFIRTNSAPLSAEAQATLRYFDDVIKSSGQKLFARIPDAEDLEGWQQRFQSEEEGLQNFNNEVVKKLHPTLTQVQLGEVDIVDIKPNGWKDSKKVLVYLHGGGFVLNSAATQKIGSVPLSTISRLRTLVIDYPRAPFVKHPHILEHILSVFKTLHNDGYAMKDIGIYGDSAGGNLAVATTLKMQEEGMDMPGALAVWSPWLDLTLSDEACKTLEADDPILSIEALRKCARAYAPLGDHAKALVSPLFSEFTSPMPPVLIQYGTNEMLAPDALRFYNTLKAANQNVTLSAYNGMWHGFQAFGWELPESQKALSETSEFFHRHLGESQ
jgi:monoterpene epsilon-lactone hydrolase